MRALVRALAMLLIANLCVAPAQAGPPIFPQPADTSVQAALATRAIGNIATSVFGGRMTPTAFDATGQTFESLKTTALGFDAVRVVFAVTNTSALDACTPTVTGSVVTAADPSDATVAALGASSYTPLTFGGATSTTFPPAVSAVRRALYFSDWMPVSSVARTDGGQGAVVVAHAYLSGCAKVALNGFSSSDFTGWGTHPSGRLWKTYRRSGDYASGNQQLFRAGATRTINGLTPIIGFQYLARGKVVNVFGSGDSITEGAGSSIFGTGFIFPAVVNLSNASSNGVAYEYSDLGWSSTEMGMIRDNTVDALNAGLIGQRDIVVIPSGSPNGTAGTINASTIVATRTKLASALVSLQLKGIEPIIWTWLPTNTSQKAYGSTDSLRRSYNAEVRLWAGRGATVADLEPAISGIDDGTGQIQMKAGTTDDGIHPNDVGNALLIPIIQRAIQKLVQPIAGTLVTPTGSIGLEPWWKDGRINPSYRARDKVAA